MRVHHRFLIILVGMSSSLLLWHQQSLTEKGVTEAQSKAVNEAVSKANAHSDEKFREVGKSVAGVDQRVGAVGTSLAATTTSLSGYIQKTADAIQKTSDRLDTSIGKVGKPDPPIPAKLVFSLWDTVATAEKPSLSTTANPDSDGNFPVDFTFVDSSETAAEGIDVWVEICRTCTFVKEPSGFEHPAGSDEHTRHRMFGSLNPGVSFEKIAILVKSEATGGFFQLGFRYSCKTCGGKVYPNQVATIIQGKATPRQ
jgi:hypothetical protein